MDLVTSFIVAVALAMDAFVVAIAAGITIRTPRRGQVLRMVLAFGIFQFAMTLAGWFAGQSVSGAIKNYDHWIAFGLLCIVGGKMIADAFCKHEDAQRPDPTRIGLLLVLALATSIDAFAVGLSMGLLGSQVWIPCVIIGVVAGAFTYVGFRFGNMLGRFTRRWSEVLGGAILLAIGLRILIVHLSGGA
ncbi:MAG: manganese efflux pump [Phycisphaerae bacterium]|nr:manganese efflux pump [Phycisphaerae bacterium]